MDSEYYSKYANHSKSFERVSMVMYDIEFYREIGAFLREAREARGITRDVVSGYFDVEPITVWRWENGERRISLQYFIEYCKFLELPLWEL